MLNKWAIIRAKKLFLYEVVLQNEVTLFDDTYPTKKLGSGRLLLWLRDSAFVIYPYIPTPFPTFLSHIPELFHSSTWLYISLQLYFWPHRGCPRQQNDFLLSCSSSANVWNPLGSSFVPFLRNLTLLLSLVNLFPLLGSFAPPTLKGFVEKRKVKKDII